MATKRQNAAIADLAPDTGRVGARSEDSNGFVKRVLFEQAWRRGAKRCCPALYGV